MASDLFSCKLPLFINSTQDFPQCTDLDSTQISIPISLSLLDLLNKYTFSNKNTRVVHSLLNEIVSSPSYLFPEISLIFDRSSWITMLVPDDNLYHKLNWNALILQFHISLLQSIGYNSIVNQCHGPKTASFEIRKTDYQSNQENIHNMQLISSLAPDFSSHRERAHKLSVGSFRLNQQNKCIGSFSLSRRQTVGPTFDTSRQYSAVKPLQRRISSGDNSQDVALDINPLLNIQINCSSHFFKSLVLTVAAHGILDRCLGHLIAHDFERELKEGGVKLSNILDSSNIFNEYLSDIQRCLFDPKVEDQIIQEASQDHISATLDYFTSIMPFTLVPHSRSFIESIVAPLCYHENAILADRAIEIYSSLLNGHQWEVHETAVSTVDAALEFPCIKTGSNENLSVLLSVPIQDNNENLFSTEGNVYLITLGFGQSTYQPLIAGFYDYCYVRISETGEYELEQSLPTGRYIVLPPRSRNEIIHEMCAFDEKGPISFTTLSQQLQTLSDTGVTAVHVSGVFQRSHLHRLTTVTDHCAVKQELGGMKSFIEFCNKAKSLGLRVCVDFMPLISAHNWSRKYTPFQALKVDNEGVYQTAKIPLTELMLLNMRSIKFWDLLSDEMIELCKKTGISGFFLGNVEDWDYVYPRDMRELLRIDPDGQQHYYSNNIIEGSVILESTRTSKCGITSHSTKYSPFLIKLMRKLWSFTADAFVWMKAEDSLQSFVVKSGIIPQNNAVSKVLKDSIDKCFRTDDLSQITVSKTFDQFFKKRNQELPPNSLVITSLGSVTDGPFQISQEGLSLAIDILFFLPDVPLISGCLDTSMAVPSAYDLTTPRQKAKKWSPPAPKFRELLSSRAGATRGNADWVFAGDWHLLPVAYDSTPVEAVLAIARINSKTKQIALICMCFYSKNIIFEVSVKNLGLFQDKKIDNSTVIELKPILSYQYETSYYGLNEIFNEGSSFFLDIEKFSTCVYELNLISPPIPPQIERILSENVYTRLQRAISFHSIPVLAHNIIFKTILDIIDNPQASSNDVFTLVQSLPNDPQLFLTFREALFYATRYIPNPKPINSSTLLTKLTNDDEIEQRESRVIQLLKEMKQDNQEFISTFSQDVMEANKLGPIMFIAPELGPFSKVGGLSTMVWELAKELVSLGLDIHVVSPYYNVSPQGEQDSYLDKYGVEYQFKMDVYAPDKVEISVYYGLVEGVKCWFIRNYTYFTTPYQTGSTSFKLQLLVLMAKAPLELCCQTRLIPSLFVTNDWMTGLTAAYGRKAFGAVFNGSKFMHIFHNLGVGYAGKIWPNDGDTSSMHYIHQLPDELIVDPFDHSFDPSLCTLLASDQWATVSKKYRDELLESSPYNYFLKSFNEPFAYSNGIRLTERLNALKKLGMDHNEAKKAIQKKYFGKADETKCVFVFVGRIVEQKGVYLIVDTFEELNKKYNGQLQFIVGGQAAADDREYGLPCTQKMWDLKKRYPDNFWADPSRFFSDGLLCDQGADFMLIPSLFEPSGIVQQEAFASGTPVIAFRTGGLVDTVFEYDKQKQTGNGFLFWSHRHHDFAMAVERAYDMFCDTTEYAKLRENAFKSVLSTEKVAREWAREFSRLFMKIYMSNQNNENYQPIIPEFEKRRMAAEAAALKAAEIEKQREAEDQRKRAQKLLEQEKQNASERLNGDNRIKSAPNEPPMKLISKP